MKAFISWSGGKDSALSCHRVMQNLGIHVTHFLNMLTEDGTRSRSHGLEPALLQLQAKAAGVALVQGKAGWDDYEKEFKKAILELKKEGVEAGVFGDIDLQPHRDWVERVCKETGIRAILPIWNEGREKLLDEFIDAGFRAKIVVADSKYLDDSWLGCEIDREFIKKAKAYGKIDLCGEGGEYHTFVCAGPIFEKPVEFTEEKKVLIGGTHWCLALKVGNGAKNGNY